MIYAGWTLTALAVMFLVMDAVMKIVGAEAAVKATTELGFDASMVRVLGLLLLVCTTLYAIPQTSVLGAILVTAYLGGTVAIHLHHKSPLPSHVLFGVYLGLFVWGGLFFRMPALRRLLPLVTD